MNDTRKPARTTGKTAEGSETFSAEEREAMRERAQELKSARRGARAEKGDGERDVLAKIAEMPQADREMAERIHALVKASAPSLIAKTWYGMPAYAKEDKVVCYFQSAHKFKSRFATLGFSDAAKLDEGNMWPLAFALTELTPTDEARIAELVRRAVS